MVSDSIGEFRIEYILGEGGMATVYKAYQPSFERYVAIKLLLHEFADAPKFLERFQHEAKTIARLEHRAILPVYAYGEHEGRPYIVMRLLEGGSLRRRLRQGPLDPTVALRICIQVAEALDYAHDHGVIHRDLKPSNILLDQNGNAYLTDFGIAQLLDQHFGEEGDDATRPHEVVGTPSYMSPEQCQGKPATSASDIYALGAILYELLTGKPPFEGDTPLEVMTKHVREPRPSVVEANPMLPPVYDRVIARAMAVNPEDRYPTAVALAADFRNAVRAAADLPPGPYQAQMGVTGPQQPVDADPRRKRRRRLLIGVGAVLIAAGAVAVGVGVWAWLRGDEGVARLLPALGSEATVAPTATGASALVAAAPSNTPVVIVLPTATVQEVVITSTAKPTVIAPTLLPTETPIPEVTATPEGDATDEGDSDGTVAPTATAIAAADGEPWLAFTQGDNAGAEIVLMALDGDDRMVITDNGLYDGEPDWSPDGTRLAFESMRQGSIDIYTMSVSGDDVQRITTSDAPDRHPDWSPDGSLIAYESGDSEASEIYVISAAGGEPSRLTTNSVGDRAPVFSPDGTHIAYMTEQRGRWEIAIMSYPGGELEQIFDCPGSDCRFPSWSPDGTSLVFNTLDTGGLVDAVYSVDVASGESTLLVDSGRNGRAVYSGDGLSVYFNRPDNNVTNLYRVDLASGDVERVTTSSADEYGPDWGAR
jgi:hypothetical protein